MVSLGKVRQSKFPKQPSHKKKDLKQQKYLHLWLKKKLIKVIFAKGAFEKEYFDANEALEAAIERGQFLLNRVFSDKRVTDTMEVSIISAILDSNLTP